MVLEITIPQIGARKKSARDLVISILAYHHSLTLATLTRSIQKKYASSVTFQGIRKAVNVLMEEGVIVRNKKEYLLDKEWIANLVNFANSLHESHFSNQLAIKDFESLGENLKVYTFKNLIDTDQYLNHLILEWFKQNPGGKYLQFCNHAYFALGNLKEESKINEKIKYYKVQFYTFAGSNTLLDKWVGRYFKGQGFHYISEKQDVQPYFGVYRDFYFQYETPPEITKELDKIFSQTRDLKSLDFAKLINLLRKESNIKVTVMKNPLVASRLRETIENRFK